MSQAPSAASSPLRVCLFGAYSPDHGRIQMLVRGLRSNGVLLHECNEPLWKGTADKVRIASGGWFSPRFWGRLLRTYLSLFAKYLRAPSYDIMLLGYPSQIDAFPARILTWLAGRPLVIDLLMSVHLVAEERGLTSRHPVTGRIIHVLERTAFRLSDLVLCENEEYISYLCRKYRLSSRRFRPMAHGVNDSVYAPREPRAAPDGRFRVSYHGGFLKSHGIPTMIRAAAELSSAEDIRFVFYGDGPEREACMALARSLRLGNVEFPGFVSQEDLLRGIAMSDLMLGVFGTTRHALMTIQNKLWEALGMGRPVVSGDSETVRRFLTHGRHLYLVERENPGKLAAAILELKARPDLRDSLGQAAREYVRENNTIVPLGRAARDILVGVARRSER